MGKEIEQRLEALEADQIERLAAEIAQDAVLDSIIASHPNLTALRAAFRSISEYRLTQLGDVGFDKSMPADSLRSVSARVRAALEPWSRKLSED